MLKGLIGIAGFFLSLGLHAQVFDIVVAKDGSGDFKTLGSALGRFLPENQTERVLVFVKNGIYNEKVILESTKTNISLIGENVDSVIITWDDYSGKGDISTADSYTFWADGNDFYAENITFQNTAGNVGQAVAIRTTGDRQVFKNCKFIGFQDTYYAHKNRQYNLDCHVEGATDFIFGDATAVFDNCTVKCVQGGQYITAPADTKLTSTTPSGTFYHGLLFRGCDVIAGEGVGAESYYLGRPWQPNASSVFIECTLDDHIKKAGWSVWSDNNHESGFYGEYMNINTNGDPVDTSERVDWNHQLTQQEVEDYYNLSYFFKKDNVVWDPTELTADIGIPVNISSSGNAINWDAIDGAKGYLVYRNNNLVDIAEGPSFQDTSINKSGNYSFQIKAVGAHGNLGAISEPIIITSIGHSDNEMKYFCKIDHENRMLYFSEEGHVILFSVTGSVLVNKKHVRNLSVAGYCPGIYFVSMKTLDGRRGIQKIIINKN